MRSDSVVIVTFFSVLNKQNEGDYLCDDKVCSSGVY